MRGLFSAQRSGSFIPSIGNPAAARHSFILAQTFVAKKVNPKHEGERFERSPWCCLLLLTYFFFAAFFAAFFAGFLAAFFVAMVSILPFRCDIESATTSAAVNECIEV
jgi:uncharacterized membrane protein YfcA